MNHATEIITVSTYEGELSPYEMDIWVETSRNENSHQFTVALHKLLPNAIVPERLKLAAEVVLASEPASNKAFHNDEGQPYFKIIPYAPLVDVHSDKFQDEKSLASFFKDWSRKVWDLSAPPLIEVAIGETVGTTALFIRAHHIVADSWALNLLAEKIIENYGKDTRQLRTEPSAPDQTFARQLFSTGNEPDRGIQHITALIDDIEPSLFPKAESRITDHSNYRYSFKLKSEDVKRGLQNTFTPLTTVSTALAILLSHVYGSDRFFIGIPFLNRDKRELNHINQRANTLPIKVDIRENVTPRKIGLAINELVKTLKAYEAIPLGKIVSALSRPTLSRQLFDATVSYLRYPANLFPSAIENPAWNLAYAHAGDAVAVHLHTYGDHSEVYGDICLNPAAFSSASTATFFADTLRQLINHIHEKPDVGVAELPLLTPEQTKLLNNYENGPQKAYSRHDTVISLFEHQALLAPNKIALRNHDGSTFSYAQLSEWSSSIAKALEDKGVNPGDIVAIAIERAPEMIAAIFGILKAGAAYLPIDSEYPPDRVKYMLEDSGAKFVIANLPHIVATDDPRYFNLWSVPRTFPTRLVYNQAQPGSAAYVIYTSGSTGRPKGVIVEHHAVVNRLEWMQEVHSLAADDVILQKTPISFDVSVWELFWWAITGASVALLRQGAQRDPRELIRAISTHGVTVAHFVPSMFEPYIQTLADPIQDLDAVASLQCIFTSGEALTPFVVNKYKNLFSSGRQPPRLINLYGPTEATVDVTYHEVDVKQRAEIDSVPIGVPINNTAIRIVSQHGIRVPIGVAGELQIGGVQLARGYLNRPELTAERFIIDKRDANTRWYRTGDLAAWSDEGSILYLGRIDGQVKIRGNRIELGEVKSALLGLPGVRNAEVLVGDDATRGKHLVGIYVADGDIDERGIRQQLAQALPAVMIPARLARVATIPLTPNGKFDRNRAVRELAEKTAPSPSRALRETEAIIVKIWRNVLHQQNLHLDDDFYAQGGDSILMLKIRSELEAYGYDVSLTDLAQHTTVSSLADFLDNARETRRPAQKPLPAFALVNDAERARLAEDDDAYPASQLQLGLIYHSRGGEKTRTYKDVFRYTLRAAWDEAAFSAALRALVRRHPALRTTFNLSDFERPLQIVRKEVPLNAILSIEQPAADTREDAIADHIERWTRRRYSFSSGPLFHIAIFIREGSDVIDLVLSFHHAILDGGSVANLMRELLLSYAGHADFGYAENELPNPSLFVKTEIEATESDEHKRYWKNYLAGAANTRPVGLAPYSPRSSQGVRSYRFQVPSPLDNALRALANASRLPIKSLYLAAHSMTLAALSGSDEIVTGVVTHSRPDIKHAEHLLGLFLNTLPLRVDLKRLTWLQLVDNIDKSEKRNHRHRLLPLAEIQALTETLTIQTAFNYIHFHVLQDISAKTDIEMLGFRPSEETNFSVLVNVMRDPLDQSTSIRIDLDGEIYAKEQGETFARLFRRALEHIAYRPHTDATLSEPLTAIGAPLPPVFSEPGETVPGLIRQAAANHSGKIALTLNDDAWTYKQLWDASANIASLLRAQGVRQRDIVGVALPRSFEQIAAVIAILRLGGVCLPVDVSYPLNRIRLILDIAEPAALISAPSVAGLPPFERLIVMENGVTPDHVEDLDAAIKPADLAYLLFTSGSTGTPKGVAMPHGGLSNLVNWQNAIGSGARIESTLQFAPLSFDVSFQEIASTLSAGGTLHLVDEEERRDPAALLRLLDRKGVERIYLPYVALQQLAEAAVTLELYPRKLRVVASSGEQLRVTREIRAFISALTGGMLENQYGPTETHVVAYHNMSGDAAHFPVLPPIGAPIDGVGIAILDRYANVVPDGVPGEICVFGKALAAGYYRSPEQTRQKFIEHPDAPGGRFYRTGDIGVRTANGAILCLGRNDTQVKVRGYRVELSEIELKILQFFESIGQRVETAVIARPRDDLDAYLVAFLVGQEDRDIQARLSQYLAAELPTYMAPTHIAWIDALPKTPSGKRDDASLRNRDIRIESDRTYRASADQYERRLCELTAELLKLPGIAPEQSIFDCGATSLTAMRIVVLVEKLYGINVPLSAFVSAPTIAGLAKLIREGGGKFKFDPLVPLRESGNRTPLFLVHPMGGNILSYLRLLPHLPADRPLYALQASGVDAGSSPILSIEAQAAFYIDAIERFQPSGPYILGGWSYGGFVAFEMAKQLIQAGKDVSHILILDTMALSAHAHGKAGDDALITWFFWELLWTSRGSSLPVDMVPPEIVDLQERFDYITEYAIKIGAIPAGSTKAVMQRLFAVYRANWHAATAYDAGRPALDITLIRAREPLPAILRNMHDTIRSEYQDPKNGWETKTAGKVNVIEIDGDHLTIMEEPYVRELVSAMLDEISMTRGDKHV